MPKLKNRVPSYRLHRASGQAVVTLGGKDYYLGPHGSPESREQYNQFIAEWLTAGRPSPRSTAPGAAASDLSINELIVAFWQFAESYYVKNGKPTGEVANLRDAIRPLAEIYGRTPVRQFGPIALETVRARMIEHGLCRTVVNSRINRVRRLFKWGVGKQLVDPAVLQALQAVAPLKRGRCEVRESEGVRPVAQAMVDAVLPKVPRQIAAMIRLQLFTGMRPGEVTIMRSCDIDATGKVWVYQPPSHKTEHHGRGRTIYLGPQAQQVVRPFLKPDLQAFLFSPHDVMEELRREWRARRKTPMTPSQRRRRRKVSPRRSPGERYTTQSYGYAIYRGCDAAFPPSEPLRRLKVKAKKGRRWETHAEWKQRLDSEKWTKLLQWRSAHRWSPNQLRHNAATFLRKEFGIEAARVVLGHNSADVTEVYAELDLEKAASIMSKVG